MEGVEGASGVGRAVVLTLPFGRLVVLGDEGALTFSHQVAAKYLARVLARDALGAVFRRHLVAGLVQGESAGLGPGLG